MDDDAFRRTDTAERPAVVVRPDPAPLAPAPGSPPDSPSGPPAGHASHRPVAPPWIAWVVVVLALVSAAVLGAYLVLRPAPSSIVADDPAGQSAQSEQPVQQEEPQAEATDPGDEAGEAPAQESAEPSEEPEAPAIDPSQAEDLTGRAKVRVPAAAPANNDVTGEVVTFVGPNLLDGNSETAWRMPGDASGRTLTFTFDQPVVVTALGLLNGYAKTSVDGSGRSFDWYLGNRRVTRVEWVLGDQVVPATYGDAREVQFVGIEPTETTRVELRILQVTPPGAGPTGRDYTAISAVSIAGVPVP